MGQKYCTINKPNRVILHYKTIQVEAEREVEAHHFALSVNHHV
jgi:hypothetical protein